MYKIQSKIDSKDLYKPDDEHYGLEKEHHITILYGIHKNVKWDDFKNILIPIEKYNICIPSISVFENEKYDVLKFDINCEELKTVNKKIKDTVSYTSNFPKYKAHMTIAYLNKGTGKKYIDKSYYKILIPKVIRYNYSKHGTKDNNEYHKIID